MRTPRLDIIKAAASLVIGASAAFSFANHFLRFWTRSNPTRILLLVVLTMLFGVLSYLLIKRVLWPLFKSQPANDRIAWMIIALASGLAISAIPGVTPFPPGWHTLEITATGDKNSIASGSQVWLAQLSYGNQVLPLRDCNQQGDWQPDLYELKGLFSKGTPTAIVTCQFFGSHRQEVKLLVYSHPAGGIVLLKMDGKQQVVDLYARSQNEKEISLWPSSPLAWKIVLHGLDTVAIGFCLLGLMAIFNSGLSQPITGNQKLPRWAAQKSELLVLSSIVVVCLVMVLPFWGIVHTDEEHFRVAILSTVLHGRAVAQGYFPFWTSNLGFGMPMPFFSTLNDHPLFLLVASNTGLAIILIYFIHLVIGGYGMWRLCLYFEVKKPLSLACVLTYLLASSTLLYLYANFWINDFIGWSALPFITLFCIKLLDARSKDQSWFYALVLGTIIGLTGLSSHITIFFMDCVFIALLVLANGRLAFKYWRELLVCVAIILLICSSKIFFTFQEYTAFSQNLLPPLVPTPFGWNEFWGLFFWPVKANLPPLLNHANLALGGRVIFFGPIFVIIALVGIFAWRKINTSRVSLLIPFIAFCLVYVFRPAVIYNFVNAPIGFCDSMILMGILIAGMGLSRLVQKGNTSRYLVMGLLTIQSLTLLYGAAPFIQRTIAAQVLPEPKNVLANVLRTTPFIKNLQQTVGSDGGRLILSSMIDENAGSNKLMSLGLSTNSLAYHNLRVVNGFFQGISYKAFCQDTAKSLGSISSDGTCPVENQALLDIANVKYALKYTDEQFLDGFVFRQVLGTDVEGKEIGLYENPQAWNDANYMDRSILSLDLCTTGKCGPDLFSSDLTPVIPLRQDNHPPITVTHKYDTITLTLAPENVENVVILSEYYRPEWKAFSHGAYGVKEIAVSPVLKSFIGLKIPPGTSSVSLVYRPIIRMILEVVSLTSLLLSFAALIGYAIDRRRKNNRKKSI